MRRVRLIRVLTSVLLAGALALPSAEAFGGDACPHHAPAAAAAPVVSAAQGEHAHHASNANPGGPASHAEHDDDAPCTCLGACCPAAAVSITAGSAVMAESWTLPVEREPAPHAAARPRGQRQPFLQPPATAPPHLS